MKLCNLKLIRNLTFIISRILIEFRPCYCFIAVLKSFHDILSSFWLHESNKILQNKKKWLRRVANFGERIGSSKRTPSRWPLHPPSNEVMSRKRVRTIDEIFHTRLPSATDRVPNKETRLVDERVFSGSLLKFRKCSRFCEQEYRQTRSHVRSGNLESRTDLD